MNDILSFGIPTYNRAEMLDEALAYFYDILQLSDFQLFISDNCSTDNTIQVIKKYASKYDNIQFYIQDKNIGADRNMIFLQDHCNTKYFLLLGDGVRFFKEQIHTMINMLKTNDYDAILFNYRSRIDIKSKFYTDINEILSDLGWAITQMSSYILSKKVLAKKVPDNFLIVGSEFNYYSRFFYYIAENEFHNVYWYSENCLTFSRIPKLNSWHNRFMDVWMGQYVETVLSLPINYTLTSKLNCLKSFSHYYLFQLESIINLIINNCINSKQVYHYRKNIPFILQFNWRFYYVLCFLPKIILRLILFGCRAKRKIIHYINSIIIRKERNVN
jgi:glycosyltransferase involved in cell wall biosynthesis